MRPAGTTARGRIAVVGEDPALGARLQAALVSESYQVVTATSPVEALAAEPDLVVLDRRAAEQLIMAVGSGGSLNLEERERATIREALRATGWNKQAAARLLGLHRPTLYSKMRKHGIPQRPPSGAEGSVAGGPASGSRPAP
jgi:DNA-binding NtrC family response regulator